MPKKSGPLIGLLIILCLVATSLGTFDSDLSHYGALFSDQEKSLNSSDVLTSREMLKFDPDTKCDECVNKKDGKPEQLKRERSETQTLNKRIKLAVTDTLSRKRAKIWDQWGNWSGCSVTCGVGSLKRWRHCIGGGCLPGEKKAQLKICTSAAC